MGWMVLLSCQHLASGRPAWRSKLALPDAVRYAILALERGLAQK
jgi:hypothetical protein